MDRDTKKRWIAFACLLTAIGGLAIMDELWLDPRKYELDQPLPIGDSSKYYGIGEHTFSVPISFGNDMIRGIVQHNYFPGYEPVGITITELGENGGAIFYTNVEEMDNISYSYFEKNNIETDDKKGTIKRFDTGQHILSIPVYDNPSMDSYQYAYHEGYELVGVASFVDGYKGGVTFNTCILLYKNITPVNVTCNDSGYACFGTPIEKSYTKKLTKNS